MLSVLAREILDCAAANGFGQIHVNVNVPSVDQTFDLTVLPVPKYPGKKFSGENAKAAWQELLNEELIAPSNSDVMSGESGIYVIT